MATRRGTYFFRSINGRGGVLLCRCCGPSLGLHVGTGHQHFLILIFDNPKQCRRAALGSAENEGENQRNASGERSSEAWGKKRFGLFFFFFFSILTLATNVFEILRFQRPLLPRHL